MKPYVLETKVEIRQIWKFYKVFHIVEAENIYREPHPS